MPEMMYSGCICGYSALNFDKIFVLCKGSSTCICLEEKFCLAAGEPQFPIGMIKEDGFICKVGLPCCTTGLKMPDTKDLISNDAEFLCMRSVAQFPFGDKGACLGPSLPLNRAFLFVSCARSALRLPCATTRAPLCPLSPLLPLAGCSHLAVSKPVCAVCFLQCLPEVGCMKPGPGGGAPPAAETMER